MFKVSATMCANPQCAGRTRSPPRCRLPSKGQGRDRVILIVAVIPLSGRLGLPRRHRSYGSVLNLVAATCPGLGDLAHKLLSDETLQRDAAALVEVTAKTSLEDRPGFGALLYLAGILVAVGVVRFSETPKDYRACSYSKNRPSILATSKETSSVSTV